MKKLLGILVIGFYRILEPRLELFEIKQRSSGYDRR